jgi:hypothetical protein
MSESKISAALIKGLTEAGCYVWKANDARTVGIPDIVGCTARGRHLGVETKLIQSWPQHGAQALQGRTLSRQQYLHLKMVADRGGLALLAIGCPVTHWTPQTSGKYGCVLVSIRTWERLAGDWRVWPQNVPVDELVHEMSTRGNEAACTGSMSSMFSPPAGMFG